MESSGTSLQWSTRARGIRTSHRKRILATKRPSIEKKDNFFRKLMKREIDQSANWNFKRNSNAEKFRNFQLQEEFDTYDPNANQFQMVALMKRRSKVVEIVSAHDIIFVLVNSGACTVIDRITNKRICFMNVSSEEVVRSLFYNKNNDSLITVSVCSCDNFSSLKCRTTPLEYIRRGRPDCGFALFEDNCLKWPGFVEFDDVNGKVLTYSADDRIYKIYDLKNYNLLYCLTDKNILEIKISPGIMLLIYDRTSTYVPLKILCIEDGKELKSFNQILTKSKKVDFIEQFNEKLLVKQEGENLQILDIRNLSMIEVSKNEFTTPSAFIFLYENQLFLTFRRHTVSVWNFKGEMVTSFEDHLLWYPQCNTNNIYITGDQDIIISNCKPSQESNPKSGSINISHILSGKLIAKIQAEDFNEDNTFSKRRSFRESPKEALEDVTALFYDEERNEIYTGNCRGLLHVWTN